MDEISRTAFDKTVKGTFPNAHKTREEYTYGWVDTIDLNSLRIHIRVYTEDHRRMRRGEVMVELHGVRRTIDSSTVLLWHSHIPWEALDGALVGLRKDLLGIAAAILMITGADDPHVGPSDPVPFEARCDFDDFLF